MPSTSSTTLFLTEKVLGVRPQNSFLECMAHTYSTNQSLTTFLYYPIQGVLELMFFVQTVSKNFPV